MDFPEMIRIRQTFESKEVSDIRAEMTGQIERLPLQQKVKPGDRVAVACSSRGLANYPLIVRTVVASLKRLECIPFIFPAMGSHGAATAEGQARVLKHLGISEDTVGAPVVSSLDVVELGKTREGIPVYLDKNASQAEHIVLINRIKKHTEFEHEFESGLLKMLAIGLGKQRGAEGYHQAMMSYGYPRVILAVAKRIMAHASLLFAVGSVENGYNQTAELGICLPEELETTEKRLFREAKRLTPTLPFEEADIIVIDEMGKDISGTGFDTKVVGRIGLPLVSPEPERPRIKRIVVCSLTDGCEGNAVGVGLADVITQRLRDKIDLQALKMNTITGFCPEMGKIPLTMPSDQEAVCFAIRSLGLEPAQERRIIRIKNTRLLSEIDVSQAFEQDLANRPELQVLGRGPMAFDSSGELSQF